MCTTLVRAIRLQCDSEMLQCFDASIPTVSHNLKVFISCLPYAARKLKKINSYYRALSTLFRRNYNLLFAGCNYLTKIETVINGIPNVLSDSYIKNLCNAY